MLWCNDGLRWNDVYCLLGHEKQTGSAPILLPEHITDYAIVNSET